MKKKIFTAFLIFIFCGFGCFDAIFAQTSSPAQEIRLLRREIAKHNYNYYVLDAPEVSDAEYDRLYNRLLDLEQKYPQFADKSSPTAKIGAKSGILGKIKHRNKMYSLKKVYSEADLRKWYAEIAKLPVQISCEPKLDGLAVSLVYKNGKFYKGATRGDGLRGEDVTKNLKMIKSVPKTLPEPLDIEIRGEVVVSVENFENFSEDFSTPRNYAAGSLRQKNPDVTKERNLDFIAYQALENRSKTQQQAMLRLKSLGFITVEPVLADNFEEMKKYVDFWQNERKNHPYPTDGAVFKVNDFDLQKSLGYAASYPNWAVAFKYSAPMQRTILKNVEFTMGKNGTLTPVAIFDPVELNGTTCKKATLHNISQIKKMNLQINDKIVVEKTGEILPQIVSCEKTEFSKKINIPERCPFCGAKLSVENKNLKCENAVCPEKIVQNLVHFASKNAMGISGLGEGSARALVYGLDVKNISDIYKFKPQDFEKLDGFDEKSAQKLYFAIQNSKNRDFEHLLYALNIPYAGKKASAILAKKYKNIDDLKNADLQELSKIPGLNKRQVKSVCDYFKNGKNSAEFAKFKAFGLDY